MGCGKFVVAGPGKVYFAAYNFTSSTRTILEFDVNDQSNPRLSCSWPSTSTGVLALSPDGNTVVEASRNLGGAYVDEAGFRVYDLVTGNVVMTVPLGPGHTTSISNMAFGSYGTRLYVSTFTPSGPGDAVPGAILEYKTGDYSLAYTYTDVCSATGFGAGAMAVSVSPDGNTLFYSDHVPDGDDRFVALDHYTMDKKGVHIGGFIVQILPCPEPVFWPGKYAYAVLEGKSSVAVIDTAARQVIYELDVGGSPKTVATSLDGTRLYITDSIQHILVTTLIIWTE